MARIATTFYAADADTEYEWATSDQDPFDRELDLSFLARALERHTHASGRGLAVARLDAGIVDTIALGPNAVTTVKIADLQVTTPKLADSAVTTAKIADAQVTAGKLAPGAASANLSFTPINKAGDSGIGALSLTGSLTGTGGAVFTTGGVSITTAGQSFTCWSTTAGSVAAVFRNTGTSPGYGIGILTADGNNWEWLHQHNASVFTVQVQAPTIFATVGSGTAPFTINSTTLVTNLNSHYLNGQPQSYYGRASYEVPAGLHAYFLTAASIPSGWNRQNNADGRIINVAGTTASRTWNENSTSGSSWNITHTLSNHVHTGPNHSHGLGNVPNKDGGSAGGSLVALGSATQDGGTGNTGAPSNNNTNTYSFDFPVYTLVLAVKT